MSVPPLFDKCFFCHKSVNAYADGCTKCGRRRCQNCYVHPVTRAPRKLCTCDSLFRNLQDDHDPSSPSGIFKSRLLRPKGLSPQQKAGRQLPAPHFEATGIADHSRSSPDKFLSRSPSSVQTQQDRYKSYDGPQKLPSIAAGPANVPQRLPGFQSVSGGANSNLQSIPEDDDDGSEHQPSLEPEEDIQSKGKGKGKAKKTSMSKR